MLIHLSLLERINYMKALKSFITILRHISFILFLYSAIIFYPLFNKILYGNIYLVIFIMYIAMTFIAFFIKSKDEEESILNNIVICLLHFYFLFITYSYSKISIYSIDYFKTFDLTYFILIFCMFILTMNKILLINSKN